MLTLMVLSDEALNSMSPAIHSAHTGPCGKVHYIYREDVYTCTMYVGVSDCEVYVTLLTAWPTKVPLHLNKW